MIDSSVVGVAEMIHGKNDYWRPYVSDDIERGSWPGMLRNAHRKEEKEVMTRGKGTRSRSPLQSAGVGIWVGVLIGVICILQSGAAPTAAEAKNAAQSPPLLKVIGVSGSLGLDRPISVKVTNLREYLKPRDKDPKKFVLYLDGRRIDGVTPLLVPGENILKFDVKRTDASKDAWNALLGAPKHLVRNVSVSVGYDQQEPVETMADSVQLYIVQSSFWGWACAAAFLLAAGWFWLIATTTNVIREVSDEPLNKRPYSLGRIQMAFWFFIVLGSFTFVWLVTGATPPVSNSALALIGISAGTALGARVVDVQKDEQWKQNNPNNLTAQNPRRTHKSKGLANDLLADADGYSFHRFQMVVWTIVLGLIFISTVHLTLAMPEFDGTLLALMGISSGTYIGFKFPEK